MGENSKIEWTTHTFNPWWGCTKVSEACKHCYAEIWAKRLGKKVWGPKNRRRFFTDQHWKQPIIWNKKAAGAKQRPRVFCASMADVFEDREELKTHRRRLWKLIADTPNLDWLLLTKRPQNIKRFTRWGNDWPPNIWIGTTVELQTRAEELLPYLDKIPAKVRFISAEPLLGPLSIEPWLGSTINWVITGGESGARARPASPKWFDELHKQCKRKKVPFHFKQWGDWAPGNGINLTTKRSIKEIKLEDGSYMIRIGKNIAGRQLNGKEWNGLPKKHIQCKGN